MACERPGRGDLGKPTGSPDKLERAAFPQFWPFPASPWRRAVNQKDKEFVAGLFGSANRFRTQGLLVNSLTPLSISVPANLVRTYGLDELVRRFDRSSSWVSTAPGASRTGSGSYPAASTRGPDRSARGHEVFGAGGARQPGGLPAGGRGSARTGDGGSHREPCEPEAGRNEPRPVRRRVGEIERIQNRFNASRARGKQPPQELPRQIRRTPVAPCPTPGRPGCAPGGCLRAWLMQLARR